MEAAQITWRPLGQLFVERGLITQDELEEALVEQRETRKRLGTILVSRGLVSGPELTSVLVDQLGIELTKESGFGSGLWDEIRKRHPRGGEKVAPAQATPVEPVEPVATQKPDPTPEPRRSVPAPRAIPDPTRVFPDPAQLEAALAKEREAVTAGFAEERAELQAALEEQAAIRAALDQERASLEAALGAERAAREQALEELVNARAEASARAAGLADLTKQVGELRRQVEESTAAVAAEQNAVGLMEALESRLNTVTSALAAERSKHRRAVEELDHAHAEARAEAKELRSSIDVVRRELERLDAATSWFEYWSGNTSPAEPVDE